MEEESYSDLLKIFSGGSVKDRRRALNKLQCLNAMRIKARRKDTGQTQQAVADGTGIPVATFKRLEDDPTKSETLTAQAFGSLIFRLSSSPLAFSDQYPSVHARPYYKVKDDGLFARSITNGSANFSGPVSNRYDDPPDDVEDLQKLAEVNKRVEELINCSGKNISQAESLSAEADFRVEFDDFKGTIHLCPRVELAEAPKPQGLLDSPAPAKFDLLMDIFISHQGQLPSMAFEIMPEAPPISKESFRLGIEDLDAQLLRFKRGSFQNFYETLGLEQPMYDGPQTSTEDEAWNELHEFKLEEAYVESLMEEASEHEGDDFGEDDFDT